MQNIKVVKGDTKKSGNFPNIVENSQSDESKINYSSDDISHTNSQNKFQEDTQLNPQNNAKTKVEKIQNLKICKVQKESKHQRNNSKILNDFDLLKQNDKDEKKLLNNKIKRNERDNEVKQEIITQIEINKKIVFKSQKFGHCINYSNYKIKKEGNKRPRPINIKKIVMKNPYPSTVKILEKLGNKKENLETVNLDDVFENDEKIQEALDLTLEQIICYKKYENNKAILEKIEPTEDKDKKIFNYFKTMKYKILLQNFFYNKEKNFDIKGEIIHVPDFKTFDEVLEGKYNTKSQEVKNAKVENIENMTKFILDNCEYGWVPKGSNKEANQKDDIFHNSLNSGNILNIENNNMPENTGFYYIGQNEEVNKQDEAFISKVEDYNIKNNSLGVEFGNITIHESLYYYNSISNSFNFEARDYDNSFNQMFDDSSGEDNRLGRGEEFLPISGNYQFNQY